MCSIVLSTYILMKNNQILKEFKKNNNILVIFEMIFETISAFILFYMYKYFFYICTVV